MMNTERTIENILGVRPQTRFDRVASPMLDAFQNTPDNTPFTHVPVDTPLNIGPGNAPIPGTAPQATPRTPTGLSPFEKARMLASNRVMPPNMTKADIVDENFLNHVIWYSVTGWHRPCPGEKSMLLPSHSRTS